MHATPAVHLRLKTQDNSAGVSGLPTTLLLWTMSVLSKVFASHWS